MKVVVIGGVAAGPKTASKIARLMPTAEVTVVEKGDLLSYAGCGLPYYVSGVVKDQADLMSTPVGTLRDSSFFQKVKNVRVLIRTEATTIDRENRRVGIRDVQSGEESFLAYDKLVLATGARPAKPPIPGIDKQGVYHLHNVHDAENIKGLLSARKPREAVIVGGGLIGVEMAETLIEVDCKVTLVEMTDHILPMLDWEIARLVEQHMAAKGVRLMMHTKVLAITGSEDDDDRAAGVETDQGSLDAGLVLLATGVEPNADLAKSAGLKIGPETGAIRVDAHMRTSDPAIYAVGDCAECTHRLTGRPCYVPLGSTANKQGRVAAMHLCGKDDAFPGVLGSTVCRIFDYTIARTGLTEWEATQAGLDAVPVLAPAPDKAHFMPTAKPLMMKLVVEQGTGRLLGAQATGPGDGVRRVDVVATAISAGMSVDELANLDLCYAPPYAPAMDNVITAANVARNKLAGDMRGISPEKLHRMMQNGDDFVLLDVRSPGEYEQLRLPNSVLIPLGALRGRVNELPRDKKIVTFCKISLRGYEAALILKAAGFEDVEVLDGGIVMWPYEKETAAAS